MFVPVKDGINLLPRYGFIRIVHGTIFEFILNPISQCERDLCFTLPRCDLLVCRRRV